MVIQLIKIKELFPYVHGAYKIIRMIFFQRVNAFIYQGVAKYETISILGLNP